MKQNKLPLPIDSAIPEILNAAANYSTLIIKATPGSGKTTRLPWALAQGLKKTVAVLEPRRLAAKLAANRIADEENLTSGKEVGYHFRFEKNVSPETKVTFYTEGTFLKKFLSDPNLQDIDIVILDEFHERHLDTDLALALCLELQKKKNLKIILMSATLDLRLEEFFSDARSIEVEGKVFPVETHYLPNQPSILNQSLEAKVKKAVETTSGDTLVFVPGMREMLRVKDTLKGDYEIFLLHADLSKEEQSSALNPAQKRKIILATNIAESSVTIPGIRVVIDSGIQREAFFSPWNGLKLIRDAPVTKSSAIQRAGRAGRTGPGLCLRLYSEQDFNQREDYTVPEIRRADLTDTLLFLNDLKLEPRWFEPPPEEKWQKARELLQMMGAMNESGLTPIGKKMLSYPLDARLSRALVEGEKLSRDQRSKLLRFICDDIEEDYSGTLKRRLQYYLRHEGGKDSPWEQCILTGFLDQLAKYRPKQRDFIHYSGKTLKLHHSHDPAEGLFLILDITQKQEAIKILPIEEEWLFDIEPFPFKEDEEIKFGDSVKLVIKTRIGSIVTEERFVSPEWQGLDKRLREKIVELSRARFSELIQEFKNNRKFEKFSFWSMIEGHKPEEIFLSFRPENYFETNGMSFENFSFYLNQLIDEKISGIDLERLLPDKLNLGGKRDLLIHYDSDAGAFIEAPIQDFYGLSHTPELMNGKVKLTLRLLGPHKRPIQITKDLNSFWNKTYQEMKKEYQREYPKHYWPDCPAEAKPYLLKSHLPKV